MQTSRAVAEGVLRELPRDECLALLREHTLGRVAYTDHALPAITPINYVMDGDSIVFRTASGTRLAEGTRDAVVAFEVDDTDATTHEGWSVVVVGIASQITRTSESLRALELAVSPWAGGERNHFVRITPTFISGRQVAHL